MDKEMNMLDAMIDAMLDLIAGSSPRKKKEVELLRAGTGLGKKISNKATRLAMDESLTEDQLIRIIKYFALVENGFDTFLEQIGHGAKKRAYISANLCKLDLSDKAVRTYYTYSISHI